MVRMLDFEARMDDLKLFSYKIQVLVLKNSYLRGLDIFGQTGSNQGLQITKKNSGLENVDKSEVKSFIALILSSLIMESQNELILLLLYLYRPKVSNDKNINQ